MSTKHNYLMVYSKRKCWQSFWTKTLRLACLNLPTRLHELSLLYVKLILQTGKVWFYESEFIQRQLWRFLLVLYYIIFSTNTWQVKKKRWKMLKKVTCWRSFLTFSRLGWTRCSTRFIRTLHFSFSGVTIIFTNLKMEFDNNRQIS